MKAVVEVVAVDEVEDVVMGEAVKALASIVALSIMRAAVQLKMERRERQLKGVDMLGLVAVVAVVVVSIMERLLMGNALVEYSSATVELAMGKSLFFKS